MFDPPEVEPAVLAEDLWVKFLIRYHRTEITLRETFVRAFERFGPGDEKTGRWRQAFWALKGVNIVAYPGDVIGIIGRNGCGKTTLLKSLGGILGADRGRVAVRGKVSCLLSFGVGFNPLLSGRENIYLNGSILGLSRRMIDERFDDIVAFSELGDFIHAPVRTYSAGMKGRLGFSIAVHIDPDVLLLDEVLSVGDASFRRKAGSILNRYRSENKTVVVASHSMDLIRKQCTRVYWIAGGRVLMEGDPQEVTQAYLAHSALDGIKVDLTQDLAPSEVEDAKTHWRANGPIQVPYSRRGPHYASTLCRVIAATQPRSVFEFGCNAGRNLKLLSSRLRGPTKLAGMDINEEAIAYGRDKLGLSLESGDETSLSRVPGQSWDVVFTVSALVHLPRLARVADELIRISRNYFCLYEPYLPGRHGKILSVQIPGDETGVVEYSYFHDYQAYFAAKGASLVLDMNLPAKDTGIGPLYRLMVFAKPDAAPCDLEAVARNGD